MRAPLAFLLVLAALSAGISLGACGGDGEEETSAADQPVVGAAGCRQVDPPRRRRDGGQPRATPALDPAKTYDVVFRTSCGSFTVRLDVQTSPKSTSSFVSLVRRGFYDGTGFHRIVPGFVIQAGDPTGTGRGGPGYSTVEPPPSTLRYDAGVVAMAKAPRERRGTGGSQFFVITARGVKLAPEYALLGRVVRGEQVTRRIGELGDRASGPKGSPTQVVLIDAARVRVRAARPAPSSGGRAPKGHRRHDRLSCGPDASCPEG